MSSARKMAAKIPSEFRAEILLKLLPAATASMGNPEFKALWTAYFIYIDPDGVPKSDCPLCWKSVLNAWQNMAPYLQEAEQEFNALKYL